MPFRPARRRPRAIRLVTALASLLALAAATAAHAVSFNLVFESGFPEHKQQAVAAGAELWSQWLVDPHGSTVINVDVRLATPPSGQNWVASANTYWLFANDSELHIPRSAWKYRDGASSSHMDGIITFSDEVDWYTGTDGHTPAGARDMATIMAHEIGHMLGMAASYIDSSGQWGRFARGQRYLQEYDTFLRDQHDDAPEPGSAGSFDVTGDVTFAGPHAVDAFGQPVPIYAPDPFQQGSSLSHPHLTAQRALMHYASSVGRSMHGLYDYERGMFQDLQWIFNEPAQLHVMLRNTFSSSDWTSAHWHNGSAWDFGLPPIDTTDVHIHMPDAPGDYSINVIRAAHAASLAIAGHPDARAQLEITAAGSLHVAGDVVVADHALADAHLTLRGSGADGGSLTVDGDLHIAGDATGPTGGSATFTAQSNTSTHVGGTMRIHHTGQAGFIRGQLVADRLEINAGELFLINADLDTNLDNAGSLSVSGATIAGQYTQQPDARLLLPSFNAPKALHVTGQASLAGTLELSLASSPTLDQPLAILTAANLLGSFDHTILPELDDTYLALQYHDDRVDLVAGLLGDMNADGAVDTGDVAPFVLALTDPDAYASTYGLDPTLPGDINRDGAFDTGDVAPFVQLLVGAGSQSAVPEPATATLMLTVLAIVIRRRRPVRWHRMVVSVK